MLDLCSGLGGASAAMKDRGWDVLRVDVDAVFEPDVVADVREFIYTGPPLDLVWASPPCTEFARASMPWFADTGDPDLSIVQACLSIISAAGPRYWVLENVRGAVPWLNRPVRLRCGPFYLWGNFPPFRLDVPPFKERLSGKQKAERARVPYALSEALARAVEGELVLTASVGAQP